MCGWRLSVCTLFPHSNESMYGVGQYYNGINGINGTNSNFTVNVYYVLNFDNILRSYGKCVGGYNIIIVYYCIIHASVRMRGIR